MPTTFQCLELKGWPIFKQLQLEEALLRASPHNWCIVNHGSDPAIVLGISGKREELIDETHHKINPLPLIRRFSGGGTVVVDQNTLFITFICNSLEMMVPCYPKEVMRWTESIYQPVFHGLDFALKENDYVFGHRKFGGNAQYLQKNRWLHHSTLLWDYDENNMNLLKIPKKMPDYRQSRTHRDFLCTLNGHFEEPMVLFDQILGSLGQKYVIERVNANDILNIGELPHRKATHLIDINAP